MLKRGSIGWMIWNLVEAVILVAGGILCCVYCNNTDFQKTVLLIVGILVTLDAALRLALGVIDIIRIGNQAVMKTDYLQAFTGSLELALGIILILSYTEAASLEVIFKFIGLFIGIFLITVGVVALIYATVYIVKKLNTMVGNIFSIIGAALVITIGVLAIIYLTKQDTIMLIFLIIFGLILIGCGVGLAVATIMIARSIKKVKTVIKDVKEAVNEPAIEVASESKDTSPIDDENTTK